MLWLIGGVLLWSVVHLSVALTPGVRDGLADRIGENGYKGLFSLLIVASIVLLVIGWRGSIPYPVYNRPQWGHIATVALMAPALILFLAARFSTNIKRFVRHPQLTGLVLWAVAHLLGNGDRRSLVLFGGLALWSIAEIVLISRREGPWVKPDTAPVQNDILAVAIGLVAFAALFALHPYFSGVRLITR